MRAVKTIVASAVIVFALTTVAMAGVQRLGGSGQVASEAPEQAQAAQTSGVIMSAQQFAALLDAVAHDHVGTASHSATGLRHAQTHAQAHAHHATQTVQTTQTTHQPETHHTETHDGARDGTHTGSHDGGSHHGESHDGGCD